MAHIAVLVSGMDRGNGVIKITGDARTSDMTDNDSSIAWGAEVAYDALPATINAAIKTAASDAVGVEGHTVGALDTKTIFAGATVL